MYIYIYICFFVFTYIYMRLHSVCSRSVCSRLHADGNCWCVAVCCSGGCVCVLASVATMVHCNTLPYTATHCNTLQHATHVRDTAIDGCVWVWPAVARCNALQHTAIHMARHNTLHNAPHIAHRNTLHHTWRAETHFDKHGAPQRTATYCNTHGVPKRTATHCNTESVPQRTAKCDTTCVDVSTDSCVWVWAAVAAMAHCNTLQHATHTYPQWRAPMC